MYYFSKQSYDKNKTIGQENLMNLVAVAIVLGHPCNKRVDNQNWFKGSPVSENSELMHIFHCKLLDFPRTVLSVSKYFSITGSKKGMSGVPPYSALSL